MTAIYVVRGQRLKRLEMKDYLKEGSLTCYQHRIRVGGQRVDTEKERRQIDRSSIFPHASLQIIWVVGE